MTTQITLDLPPEAIEAIAQRVATILAERKAPVEDGWLRGADAIASHIGAPRSRVYALTSAGRIPVERDGSALIARRSELDEWVREGGAVRP